MLKKKVDLLFQIEISNNITFSLWGFFAFSPQPPSGLLKPDLSLWNLLWPLIFNLFYIVICFCFPPEESVTSVLKPLLGKLASRPSVRLEVDPSDLVSDAVAFYKGPRFQPNQPVKISYIGQPAIDSGGVKRQFYTDLFLQLVSQNQFKLFQGPSNRLLFHYDQSALRCGLFKVLGQIIAHSICQRCGGFPYLAPSMYYYLATGDISQASAYASITDIVHEEELRYVEKVQVVINVFNEKVSSWVIWHLVG